MTEPRRIHRNQTLFPRHPPQVGHLMTRIRLNCWKSKYTLARCPCLQENISFQHCLFDCPTLQTHFQPLRDLFQGKTDKLRLLQLTSKDGPDRWRPLTLAATLAHYSAVGPTCEGGHYEPAAPQDTPTAFHTGRDNQTGATSPAVSTRILKDNIGYKTSFIPSNSNLKSALDKRLYRTVPHRLKPLGHKYQITNQPEQFQSFTMSLLRREHVL